MDADRRREVVADLRARARVAALAGAMGAEARLRDAAEALEEMGKAPPTSIEHANTLRDLAVWYRALYPDAAERHPERLAALHAGVAALSVPKPSAAAMEERIRALEGLLTSLTLDLCGLNNSLPDKTRHRAAPVVDAMLKRINRALHPHASWCRDPSHDGPCLPEETEVERDD